MVAGGVLLMVLGALMFLFGSSVLPVGGGTGWWMLVGGGGLFWIGLDVALAGAIVGAIDRAAERNIRALASLDTNLRAGLDALWKQLDAVRSQSVALTSGPAVEEIGAGPSGRSQPAAIPAASPPPVMGYCPGCRKLRATNVAKCIYCGDMSPPLVG